MKFTAKLVLNREQLNNLICFLSYRVISRNGHDITIELTGDKETISRILSSFADPMQQKIFAAKAALEELVEEVQKHHGCKGHGTSKSVLIPLEFEDGDVCDHFGIYRNDNVKIQGLQVSSYEYDWIDENQE